MRLIGYLLGALLLLPVALVLAVLLVPERWIIDQIERLALEYRGIELDIGSLDLDLLTMTPGVNVGDVSVAAADREGDGESGTLFEKADARVALDLAPLFGGDLVLDEIRLANLDAFLAVDAEGRGNWEFLVPEPDGADEEAGGTGIPAIRTLAIEDVDVVLDDARLGRTLVLALAASGSTTDATRPVELTADGSLGELPLAVDIALTSAAFGVGDDGPAAGDPATAELLVEAMLSAGDTQLGVDGTIGEPATFGDPELAITFTAPDAEDIADLATLADIDVPALPAMEFTTDLARDGDEYVARRFDARLGENAIEGDVRADPATTPPTLYANIISRRLDLDALLAVFGGEDEAVTSAGEAPGEPAPDVPDDTPLLSDEPLDLAPLTAAFDGAIQLRAEEVVFDAVPLDAFDLRVESEGGTLTLTPDIGLADGDLSGEFAFDTGTTPAGGTLELAARGIGLDRIVAALGVDDDSFGKIGGRLRYWFEGDSVASLAASADGGLYLAMNGGKLDALLVELSAIDLIESVVQLVDRDKTTTSVDCGYADLQTENGVTDIATFVIESADTVYVADGSVDLPDESLNVTVEPHPRDASLLSITTSVNVSGPMRDPAITPGGALGARAAIAATLAAVAAPAAALLAFVDVGGGEDSPYCKGLVDALPDAR